MEEKIEKRIKELEVIKKEHEHNFWACMGAIGELKNMLKEDVETPMENI